MMMMIRPVSVFSRHMGHKTNLFFCCSDAKHMSRGKLTWNMQRKLLIKVMPGIYSIYSRHITYVCVAYTKLFHVFC